MDEKEACCKILDGLIDNEVSTVTLLNMYIKMCECLGVTECRWVHQEIVGYDTKDTVPDYRCVAGNDLKVRSEQVTYCKVGMPIYAPRGEWDPLAMMKHLKKVDGLVIESSHRIIACRAGFEFYEEQRRKDRVDVIRDIKRIPGDSPNGSFFKIMYENVNVTCSRESLIRMRNGLRTRIKNETEVLARTYGLTMECKMNSDAITVIGNNNQVAVANGDVKQTMVTSVVKEDWESLEAALEAVKVSAEDIAALRDAIQREPPKSSKNLGSAVMGWIVKMVGKAAEKTIDIPFDAATAVLTTMICKYCGC